MKSREAAVAGSFYPGNEDMLRRQLNGFFKGLPKHKKTSCIIAPHAGYVYSGKTAATAFNALKDAPTYVVISPNHTGLGSPISVSDADCWQTPLGEITVDAGLRQKILSKLGLATDELAHLQEHSIEVQLPFIQLLFPNAKVVPITLMTHGLEPLDKIGKTLALLEKGGRFCVIASSDFSHFVPEKDARQKDGEAIKMIEAMDYMGFHEMVERERLSICGASAIVAAMAFAKATGLKKGRLIRYDTSASTTRDRESVVGYAAIKFE